MDEAKRKEIELQVTFHYNQMLREFPPVRIALRRHYITEEDVRFMALYATMKVYAAEFLHPAIPEDKRSTAIDTMALEMLADYEDTRQDTLVERINNINANVARLKGPQSYMN